MREIKVSESRLDGNYGSRTILFTVDIEGNERNVILSNVLHVSDLRENLLSVAKITDKNLEVTFKRDHAVIVDLNGNTKLFANRIGNLYHLSNRERAECNRVSEAADTSNIRTWHRRLGHLNVADLIKAKRNTAMRGMNFDQHEGSECKICLRGKMSRAPFTATKASHTTKPLEIIHIDICGPMRVESKSGSNYFITFINNHSRWCEVRFLQKKSDAYNAFNEVKALIENQTGERIKLLQSDNGREYLSKEFKDFLTKAGIKRFSIAYNPEQNGTAERKNRTLLEMTRCLLIQSGLSRYRSRIDCQLHQESMFHQNS